MKQSVMLTTTAVAVLTTTLILGGGVAADYTPGAPGCNSCSLIESESECKQIACPTEYESCGLTSFNGNDAIEGGMNWDDIPHIYIKKKYSAFPKVWNAKILSGPTTYYYPSGKSPVIINGIKQYEFEKYKVELLHDVTQKTVVFDANICVNPPNGYINVDIMLKEVFELWPEEYIYALQIITDNGNGIQFFHNSYVGGAYGTKDYIDTGTRSMGTLIHESGHSMEQHRRLVHQGGDTQILNPKWRRAIQCDSIRTTGYGNSNEWEDMAEFAKIYCHYMLLDELPALHKLSPERFHLWKETLCMAESDYTVGQSSSCNIITTSPSPTKAPTPKLLYECSDEYNFFSGVDYSQEEQCGSVDNVLTKCMEQCNEMKCTVFFYQEHSNDSGCDESPNGGYQICGFTVEEDFTPIQHPQQDGRLCISDLPATSVPTLALTSQPTISPTSIPTASPIKNPTLSPVPDTTTTPTTSSPTVFECEDDFDWVTSHKNKIRKCDWFANMKQNMKRVRCNNKVGDDGTNGNKSCPVSCDTCVCENDDDWQAVFKGTLIECGNIDTETNANRKQKLCNRKGTGKVRGKIACPVACNTCP